MQIWIVAFEQYMADNIAAGMTPLDAGFLAAQQAEQACKGAQKAANEAKGGVTQERLVVR
jgi:hypothetical protein